MGLRQRCDPADDLWDEVEWTLLDGSFDLGESWYQSAAHSGQRAPPRNQPAKPRARRQIARLRRVGG